MAISFLISTLASYRIMPRRHFNLNWVRRCTFISVAPTKNLRALYCLSSLLEPLYRSFFVKFSKLIASILSFQRVYLLFSFIYKFGRVNQPTSLLFSRYLYSQFPYFQGATYSEPQQILPGDVMSNCTNRSSSTSINCFPSTIT